MYFYDGGNLVKWFPAGGASCWEGYANFGLPSLVEIDLSRRIGHRSVAAARRLLAAPPGGGDCPPPSGVGLELPAVGFDLFDSIDSPLFSYKGRLRVLGRVCGAVAALHAAKVIHLALSAHEIYLTGAIDHPDPLLFGLDRCVSGDPALGRDVEFPAGYCSPDFLAPEILESGAGGSGLARFTGASNVWALGILALYVLSREGIYPCFGDDADGARMTSPSKGGPSPS